jgi:hypothetical protein
MNYNILNQTIKKNPNASFLVVFIFLIIYQIISSLQGFELCDSGYYGAFYQNIFRDPLSIASSFRYWFSGIVGGLFVHAFPNTGLFGLRLLGVFVTSATIYLVYMLLRKYINVYALLIGLIVVTISFISTPIEFYYDNLTAFLFVAASYFLMNGLNQNRYYLILLSGVLISLNLFTRLNNILDYGLVLIILIHAKYYNESRKIYLKRLFFFFLGSFSSIVILLIIMKIIGHFDIFIDQILVLKDMASGKTQDTHNLIPLILKNFIIYKNLLIDGLFLIVLLLIISNFIQRINVKYFEKFKMFFSICILVIVEILISDLKLINTLYFFGLLSHLMVLLFYNKKNILKIISWIGLLMMIVLPLGSDGSIFNVGNFSLWISIPIAFNLFVIENTNFTIGLNSVSQKETFNLSISNKNFKYVLNLFFVIFILNTVWQGMNTCYFDPGNRIHKTFPIDNDKTKYIYTTKARAEIVNDLLKGIKPYVKEGDYLIAYESLPMIHYLTNTKPFLYTSWIASITDNNFKSNVKLALDSKRKLPMILRQKFETLYRFGQPSEDYLLKEKANSGFARKEFTHTINQFIYDNHYLIIWQNRYFVLYKPS